MPDSIKQIPVEEEYKKNLDITRDDVARFRQWVETQPHLPGNHLTDLDLILVYHCCDRSMEVSKQLLDLHFTLRTMFEPFFKSRVYDDKIEMCLNTVLYAPLPTPTVDGYRIFYYALLDRDPRNFNLNDVFKTFTMVLDLWQYEEGTWPGFVLTVNMENATLGLLAKLEIMALRKIAFYFQECLLTKLKQVHIMNANSFVDKLLTLVKPFLNAAIMDIIYIHPAGTDSVYQYISKEALPKDDGGNYISHQAIKEATIKRLQSNSEYFRNENLKRVDESLRPGGATNFHDEFGVQGSFKQLAID